MKKTTKLKGNHVFYSLCINDIRDTASEIDIELNDKQIQEICRRFTGNYNWHDELVYLIEDTKKEGVTK